MLPAPYTADSQGLIKIIFPSSKLPWHFVLYSIVNPAAIALSYKILPSSDSCTSLMASSLLFGDPVGVGTKVPVGLGVDVLVGVEVLVPVGSIAFSKSDAKHLAFPS